MKARPRAFISHSSHDLPFARRLGDRLRAQGIEVWLDDMQLKAGDVLTETIAAAIKRHDFLIVLLSMASLTSAWVRKEIRMATLDKPSGRRARLIPILLERSSAIRMPPSLRDMKYLDFSDYKAFEIGLAQLLDVMDDETPATRAPGKIERIEFIHSEELDAALKRNIERILTRYQIYTHRLGFRTKNGALEISFEKSKEFISYYDSVYDRIVTNIDYAGEEDYLRRDYTHHVLATARADLWKRASANWDLAGIESGLAAYFPCSFKGSHLFGDGAAHLAGQSVPFFDLTNTRQVSEIKRNNTSVGTVALEVWGGTFWRLRAELGMSAADRLLWRAWLATRSEVRLSYREFFRSLLTVDAEDYGSRHARQITDVFVERGCAVGKARLKVTSSGAGAQA